jgi:hypothetical protein
MAGTTSSIASLPNSRLVLCYSTFERLAPLKLTSKVLRAASRATFSEGLSNALRFEFTVEGISEVFTKGRSGGFGWK